MSRFFGMMRYSKQLLIVFIAAMIEACFVLGVLGFDVVQLIITRSNAAALSPAFIPLNIALIAVIGLSVFAVATMIIIKVIKGKKK